MTTRNSNAHFELAPQVQIERSTFDRSTDVKTSFNVGELIPFFVDEVLPGDTFQITTSKVARLQTPIVPIMDNLYLDTYYFFVPNRLVWQHWKNLMGENTASAWTPTVDYSVPIVRTPSGGFASGTVADYFGIPINIDLGQSSNSSGVNAMPFRAYGLIFNEWFRDENLTAPLNVPLSDSAVTGSNTARNYMGLPVLVAKTHDYFSSCLPAPQRGEDVAFIDGLAPVIPVSQQSVNSIYDNSGYYFSDTPTKVVSSNPDYDFSSGYRLLSANAGNLTNSLDSKSTGQNQSEAMFDNLFADLSKVISVSGSLSPMNINSLRMAFQIQRMLERDARSGTRYIELLKSHFGVTSPDARMQRPEYLGGNRVPLNIEQVVQTSSTDSTTPQGNVAGWSQTNDISYDVNKSFTEHGYIIGLMCARYDHSYQQGLERMWSRRSRYDFYWPVLAHVGEQAVLAKEIYLSNNQTQNDSVFGYQEAWAEYRYKPNYVTGEMRSGISNSLDFWHFADYYSTRPNLSDAWIREDKSMVDRTLAVNSSVSNQIFCDILVKNKCTRPMPLYSIPGLIDHF